MRPRRPMASWMVATPNFASASTSPREARVMLRWTTPSSCMAPCSFWCLVALLLEQGVQAGVDGAGVVLLDGGHVECGEVGVLDVSTGVVEVVAGTGVDVPDGADHLGAEEDVAGREDRKSRRLNFS